MIKINNYLIDLSLVQWIKLVESGDFSYIYFAIPNNSVEVGLGSEEKAKEVFESLTKLMVK